ncbi:MAG: hypothetical protein JNL08_16985 [Planctomycetes bacterium]|nr:hypothetical protein [Planctomycetota bacterium]
MRLGLLVVVVLMVGSVVLLMQSSPAAMAQEIQLPGSGGLLPAQVESALSAVVKDLALGKEIAYPLTAENLEPGCSYQDISGRGYVGGCWQVDIPVAPSVVADGIWSLAIDKECGDAKKTITRATNDAQLVHVVQPVFKGAYSFEFDLLYQRRTIGSRIDITFQLVAKASEVAAAFGRICIDEIAGGSRLRQWDYSVPTRIDWLFVGAALAGGVKDAQKAAGPCAKRFFSR